MKKKDHSYLKNFAICFMCTTPDPLINQKEIHVHVRKYVAELSAAKGLPLRNDTNENGKLHKFAILQNLAVVRNRILKKIIT